MSFQLDPLPVPDSIELETPAVLRQAARAHRHLAELKGAAGTIPNENILIDTLGLQEAKDSSAIENIITTDDELYRTWWEQIPVTLVDGVQHDFWRVDPDRLRAALRG